MDYINSYVTKKFDDEFYFDFIINYKDDLRHVEYGDGDQENIYAIEVQSGM